MQNPKSNISYELFAPVHVTRECPGGKGHPLEIAHTLDIAATKASVMSTHEGLLTAVTMYLAGSFNIISRLLESAVKLGRVF